MELPGSRSSSLLSYVYIQEWLERLKALMGFTYYGRLMCFVALKLLLSSVLLSGPSSGSRKTCCTVCVCVFGVS